MQIDISGFHSRIEQPRHSTAQAISGSPFRTRRAVSTFARRTMALSLAALLQPTAAISALPPDAHCPAASLAAQSLINFDGVTLSRLAASFVADSVHCQYRYAVSAAALSSRTSWAQTAPCSPALAICAESNKQAAAATVRMAQSLWTDNRDHLPRRRPRRIPQPDIDDYQRRNREMQENWDAYEKQKRDWWERTQDPRWKPPIDVAPPHCSRRGDCDEIGRQRW